MSSPESTAWAISCVIVSYASLDMVSASLHSASSQSRVEITSNSISTPASAWSSRYRRSRPFEVGVAPATGMPPMLTICTSVFSGRNWPIEVVKTSISLSRSSPGVVGMLEMLIFSTVMDAS